MGGPARRARGQAMVETAFALPLVFLIVFGIIEGGLVAFSLQTAHFAAQEAAQALADAANRSDADALALSALHRHIGGGTSLLHVETVRITRVSGGPPDGTGHGGAFNTYDFASGANLAMGYPSTSRDVSLCCSDTVEVTVDLVYRWRSGLLAGADLRMTASATARIEPVQ